MLGCEKDCEWVNKMQTLYDGLKFIKSNDSCDKTKDVQRMSENIHHLSAPEWKLHSWAKLRCLYLIGFLAGN